ncbi:hypothetical protein B0H12DRAFT_1240133 [Mycena haematopus]|nr:hypothetical protein B0H12DRAFT_1240133 [Mycena haematopus]
MVSSNALPGHAYFDAAWVPSPAISQHVKNLLISQYDVPLIQLERILSRCSVVQNLALITVRGNSSLLLPLLSAMPLRRLSIGRSLFPSVGIDFTHPLFSRITHLHLVGGLDTTQECKGLAIMPNLTHLALLMKKSLSIFQSTLTACTGLQVLIFLCFHPIPEMGLESLAHDVRFVCLPAPVFYADWQIGARGGDDFWVRAGKFIAQRNRGEVDRETNAPAISQHVTNLLIDDVQLIHHERILSRCSAIQNLVLIGGNSSVLPFLSAMPLRRLSISLDDCFPLVRSDFTLPLFSRITHLQLVDHDARAQLEDWRELAMIPNLTHLAFLLDKSLSIFQSTLAACPRLQVLVYLHYPEDDGGMGMESLAHDTRFVCLPAPSFYADWQIGARGGEDFWVRAEKFIAQRNCGEIDRKTYVLRENE